MARGDGEKKGRRVGGQREGTEREKKGEEGGGKEKGRGSREEGAVATADQTREVNRGQTERSLFGLLWKFGFTLKEIPVNRVNQDKCGRIGSREGAFRLQRGEWILRGKTGKGEASWKADVWIERMRNAHEKNKNY